MALAVGSTLTLTTSTHAAPDGDERKETIESLWLDAPGTSGVVETSPLFLDGRPATVHFGPRSCGRSHTIGEQTLLVLRTAVASGQPVRIDAEPFEAGGVTRRCLTGVTVFAPIR